MTYNEALNEYIDARNLIIEWGDQPRRAAEVIEAEVRMTNAALALAAAVANREGR
jgi:hypothetical protein